MKLTAEQASRIEMILTQWHEAGRAKFENYYPALDYDSRQYSKHYHVGGKYVRLDRGPSGAFMVQITTGTIYEIKAYGVPNKRKIVGEAWKTDSACPAFHGAELENCRGFRGSYDNRPHERR